MKRTFLLDVDLDGSTDLTGTAKDILAAVRDSGINALACRVWRSRHDVQTTSGAIAPLPIPTPTAPTPAPAPPIL